jgi:hypothetical protein
VKKQLLVTSHPSSLVIDSSGDRTKSHIASPHWIDEQKDSINRLRRLYFSRQIDDVHTIPTANMYRDITIKSPSSKTQILSYINRLWDRDDKILRLKDHQINVIVGYYLTEHATEQILLFAQRLQECNCHLPFSASILIAREFMMWPRFRNHAALIIEKGLFEVRDDLVREIEKVTALTEDDLENTRLIISNGSSDAHHLLPRSVVRQRLAEIFPSDVTNFNYEPDDIVLDELIYARLLTWFDVLAAIPEPSTEYKYPPSWTPEAIYQNFFVDTALDGPLKWLTKKCGYELGQGIIEVFLTRTELREVGKTLRDIASVFVLNTRLNWELESSSGYCRLSQSMKERYDIS